MRRHTGWVAIFLGTALALAACGGDDDRDALIQDRLDVGNTQEQAECYADAVIDEFGGDPAADGELADEDVEKLLDITFDCVGGADG